MTSNQPLYSTTLIKKIFASGAIGNVLETYDLILMSLMATTLSKVFFPPSTTPYAHIVDILYIFLIGLLVRPLGNIVMGILADKIGRKKLMVISLTCTGIGTIFIGFLPSYYQIGTWSTIFFILLRITQNFFAGIEYINSASYLIESSPQHSRGYYGSWTALGISGGYLLASLVTLIVCYLININIFPEWGWRFAFIFSIFGVLFGIWMRYSVPESLEFIMNDTKFSPTKKRVILVDSLKYIRNHPYQCLSISAITMMGVCLSYIYYIYIPINLITTRNFSQIQVFSLNVIALCLVVSLIPIFGKISDRFKRTSLLKVVCFLILILGVPFFWLSIYGTYWQILIITLFISIPSACFFSIYPVLITENFPSPIRCTVASLIYQIIISIELGSLPLFINHLIIATKVAYSPAYVLIFATLFGFLGILGLDKSITNKSYHFDTQSEKLLDSKL